MDINHTPQYLSSEQLSHLPRDAQGRYIKNEQQALSTQLVGISINAVDSEQQEIKNHITNIEKSYNRILDSAASRDEEFNAAVRNALMHMGIGRGFLHGFQEQQDLLTHVENDRKMSADDTSSLSSEDRKLHADDALSDVRIINNKIVVGNDEVRARNEVSYSHREARASRVASAIDEGSDSSSDFLIREKASSSDKTASGDESGKAYQRDGSVHSNLYDYSLGLENNSRESSRDLGFIVEGGNNSDDENIIFASSDNQNALGDDTMPTSINTPHQAVGSDSDNTSRKTDCDTNSSDSHF